MNTAEVLIRCLENEGVKYIFGIPGEETLELMEAIKNSSIRFITVRHEQGAAFMADVYGRLTGKAGVCLSTLGPGATNLVTGVADANSDGAPLIAITGQVGTERMHLTSHQYLDLVNMFTPITKRSKQVVRPDTVNEIVRIVFKYAEMEKPGACHIDLPCNIAAMEVAGEVAQAPLKHHRENMVYASDDVLRSVAAMISEAKRPVILAGHSAVRNGASDALTKFASTAKIPVVSTMMAKGVIPCDNTYSMWCIGIPQKDYQNYIMEQSDLVIAIGYDVVEYAPARWNPTGDKPIVHIDETPNHINKFYQPIEEVIGNISASLLSLCCMCRRTSDPEWALYIREKMAADHARYDLDKSFPPKPQKILHDIRIVMGEDDILLSDVGAHKMWIARQYHCYHPNTCIISNGFATMGIAVPGAIAAKLLNPEKKVLAVTGDGGFMMNSQELETAYREKIPFVTLVFTDGNYGLIKWKQEERYGDSYAIDFTNPDFVKYAESMHLKGYRIERTEDIIPTLREAFEQDVPSIIECPVDYSANMELSERLKNLKV
ncbi:MULTISPECIES: acetolactate synthase large subunit [unclassified Fibrobacter]|uniref:acetolactate synthase large subunit n=1 Tax=unclassified Fibrobacter TaxID=2634177 RepID=UPI000D6BA77C|nr:MULTISPECIES: acetolactate synthase large subunit [unclassified Fibrobacter]PWJ61377.1 acetolactate synthase-1/2/3 large subunit [Fibrobacter sp. UWR4]PZW65512.1 acetolactate synthase-1/2/3 large subunit [Fibrobacter sp. UWR1]